jgi:hypothetical protein
MIGLIPPARRSGLGWLAAAGLALAVQAAPARATCRFLMPIGGGATPVVTKRISPDGVLRRNNWNTDFAVDRTYARYRINLESASSEPGVFPVAAFLRFSDNTDLRVVDANPRLTPGQRLVFGPFASVPGKRTTIVNVRVGATTMPMSTGFSYRVSVEGCS